MPLRSARHGMVLAAVLFLGSAAGGCGQWRESATASTPNVILIGMDTTRADHLGCYGYSRDTTPSIDRFASRGILFERCFSQANETLYSFASLFTSRLPSELGPLDYEDFYLPGEVETLARVLQHYGYQTGGFVAGGNIHHAWGFDNGFDRYEDEWHFGSFYHTIPPALTWLERLDSERPFFLFLHGYDAHSPYSRPLFFDNVYDQGYEGIANEIAETRIAPELVWQGRYYNHLAPFSLLKKNARQIEFLGTGLYDILRQQRPEDGVLLTDRDLRHIIAHYDGCIRYADLFLGMFLDTLESRGLLDNSLVVVVGDHGEDLFEHGHINHRVSLHDASTHVPLIVRLPGGRGGGKRVGPVVSLLDVMPTILDVVGAVAPVGGRGRSLLPLLDAAPTASGLAISEGALPMVSLRTADARLVVEGEQPGRPAFHEMLATLEANDPRVSLYGVGPGTEVPRDASGAEGVALLEVLRQVYAGLRPVQSGEQPMISPELRRILMEKGYW